MNPAVIFGLGLALFIGGVWLMVWSCDHPQFGTVDGVLPHWSTFTSSLAWIPIALGACLALGAYVYTAGVWWP